MCVVGAGVLTLGVPAQLLAQAPRAGASVTVASLAAPRNVDVAPESTGELTLTWSPVFGAVGYDVFRGSHGGALALVGHTKQLAPKIFRDQGLAAGQEYDYVVAASDGTNDGPASAVATGTAYECTQTGTAAADVVAVTTDGAVYCGLGGSDSISVDAAHVVVLGGAGGDHITGGTQGPAVLYGGTGNDQVTAGAWGDTVHGDSGADLIVGGSGPDDLNGDSGNDRISGNGSNDVIAGDDGNDTLSGGAGDDVVDGGAGIDHLTGDDGNDTLTGDAGVDHLDGGAGADLVQGGDGNDVVHGGADDDIVEGGSGNDIVSGDDGSDIVQGDDGNDIVNGGLGDDVDSGGTGDDVVNAGGGSDIVDGGDGTDSVDCGTGAVQVVPDDADTDAADCSDDLADTSTQSFHGTVAAFVAGTSISVDDGSGTVTIALDGNTRLEVDGGGEPQPGDPVEVEARTDSTPPVALVIHVEAAQGN